MRTLASSSVAEGASAVLDRVATTASSATSTFAHQTSARPPSSGSSPQYRPKRLNAEAGSELLEYYESVWEDLHVGNEKNAKLAQRCDRVIGELNRDFEMKWNDVLTLQMLVGYIPQIKGDIEKVMESLGMFSSLETTLRTNGPFSKPSGSTNSFRRGWPLLVATSKEINLTRCTVFLVLHTVDMKQTSLDMKVTRPFNAYNP